MITASAVLAAGSAVSAVRSWSAGSRTRQAVSSFIFWSLVAVSIAVALGMYRVITEESSFRRGESTGRKTEIARQIVLLKAAERRLAEEYTAKYNAAIEAHAAELNEAKRKLAAAESITEEVAKMLQDELGKDKLSASGKPYCRPGCIAWPEKVLKGLK